MWPKTGPRIYWRAGRRNPRGFGGHIAPGAQRSMSGIAPGFQRPPPPMPLVCTRKMEMVPRLRQHTNRRAADSAQLFGLPRAARFGPAGALDAGKSRHAGRAPALTHVHAMACCSPGAAPPIGAYEALRARPPWGQRGVEPGGPAARRRPVRRPGSAGILVLRLPAFGSAADAARWWGAPALRPTPHGRVPGPCACRLLMAASSTVLGTNQTRAFAPFLEKRPRRALWTPGR